MPGKQTSPMFVPPTYHGVGAGAEVFETKTASFTATAEDSGKVFLIVGATAAVVVTLPAIATGPFHFRIINGSDVDLTAQSVVADTITTFNDVAADSVAFSTSSEKIGGEIEVLCNGTTLFVLARPSSVYQNETIVTS
jgi:hypothetical protein